MTVKHLLAIVRVRWRMTYNQFRRAGRTNLIVTLILLVVGLLGSLGSFGFALVAGELLRDFTPVHFLYLWDVLTGLFLFVWMIALLTEMQRSEMMSLRNLLHLPVSLSGAYFLNYLSSFISVSMLLFLPAMLGVCIASVLVRGPWMLVLLPLLASFLLMVTAVTYQLRGWLARMMQNKRARGTVIAGTTIVFVMMFQIPNIIHMATIGDRKKARQVLADEWRDNDAEARRQFEAKEITPGDLEKLTLASKAKYELATKAAREQRSRQRAELAIAGNKFVPLGWLAYGASAASAGRLVPPLLCMSGMFGIGAISLSMGYRSTMRSYTGMHTSQYRPVAAKTSRAGAVDNMLERSIPGFTEQQSVLTMATIRSILRAPEAKMALLTPLIFAGVFGSMLLTGGVGKVPPIAKPFVGLGAISMSLFGMVQFMINMFGMDRHAFRAFVLLPVPRRDILFAKNMGILPFAMSLCALLLVFTQILVPMQTLHFLATLLQLPVVFLSYFVVSNYVSIVAPVAMAFGSMKPLQPKLGSIFLQFVAAIASPLTILPAALAYGLELLAVEFLQLHVPLYLLVTIAEVAVAVWLYRRMLNLQGEHLREREQKILEVVSRDSE